MLVLFPLVVALAEEDRVFRLGFGSCLNQLKRSEALQAAGTLEPDAFVFLGDNSYHDMPSCGIPWNFEPCTSRDWWILLKRIGISFRRRLLFGAEEEDRRRREDDYDVLGRDHVFPFVRRTPRTKIFATYDDHDFGADDAGSDYPYKETSKRQFAKFWELITGRKVVKPDGVYDAEIFHVHNVTIQLIILDTRFSRTPWKHPRWDDRILKILRLFVTAKNTECHPEAQRGFVDPVPTMLSEVQWAWLETQLAVKTDVKIIASSVQLLPPNDGAESWSLMPDERRRLLNLANGSLVLSGDVHYGELARLHDDTLDVIELTSSGLTETWPCSHPNPYRIGNVFHDPNFGIVDVFHDHIRLQLRNHLGAVVKELNDIPISPSPLLLGSASSSCEQPPTSPPPP